MLLSLITAVTIALSTLNPASESGCQPPDASGEHRWIQYEQTGYVNPDGTPVMGWCWTGGGHYFNGGKPDYTPPMVERKLIQPSPIISFPCHHPGWVNMDADDPEYFAAWNRAYTVWKACLTASDNAGD